MRKVAEIVKQWKSYEVYIGAILALIVVIGAIMSTSGSRDISKPEKTKESVEQLYLADINGVDAVVYIDGKKASGYSLDKKQNIVSKETGKVVVKAKDVERAVVITVEVTPRPVVNEPVNLNPEKEKDEFPFKATILKSGVRLRSLPTTQARILKEFVEGDAVDVIDVEGEWYKVRSGDMEGYVVNSYIVKVRTG